MKYSEFEKEIKDWGNNWGLGTEVSVEKNWTNVFIKKEKSVSELIADGIHYHKVVDLKIYCANDYRTVARIDMTERFIVNLNWFDFKLLPEDAKEELFKIVTEFAATDPADREDEKRFIIPLPGLVTTDGKQQYLTHKDCKFFASRRDERLRQTWKEEHLKNIPEIYRQFAVEFDEEKEY